MRIFCSSDTTSAHFLLGFRAFGKLVPLLLVLVLPAYLDAQEQLRSEIDAIYASELALEEKVAATQALLGRQDTLTATPALGHAYHRLGLLFNKSKRYQAAINATERAVNIRETLPEADYRSLNNSLVNIAIYLKKMDQGDAGIPYLKRVLTHKSADLFHYRAVMRLAMLKAEKGDFFAGLGYLDTLIASIDKIAFVASFIKAHQDAIWMYSEMPEPEKYLAEIEQRHQVLQSYDLSAEEMVNVNLNLGIIYSRLGQHEQAIEQYMSVQKVYHQYKDSLGLGQLYNDLGVEYSILQQYEQAKHYYNTALRFADSHTQADVYDNIAFYLHATQPERQLQLYQRAINNSLVQTTDEVNINTLPRLAEIESSGHALDVLFFLIDKATAWVALYDQRKERRSLLRAQETLVLVDQLVSSIRLDSEHRQSKLFWISHGVDSYVLAVKVCFLLDDPAMAFYFMERNKSLLLLENLAQEGQARKTKFLNTSSLEDAVAQQVSENANLIEFILNEEEGFGLFVSEQATHFFALEKVPNLLSALESLQQMFTQPFESEAEFLEFERLSHVVFRRLFPFENAVEQLRGKQLTIVPDYELHSLPFELLTTQHSEQTFAKSYLIRISECAYLHSCSVYQQIGQLEQQHENGMIGFVPTVFRSDTLADLHKSETAMKEIADFFPSQLMLREQATKAAFVESLGQYSVIHINSHAGYAQNSSPWLAFYDQHMNLGELADSPSHSSLIILDACKSALGEQELGEGIMSLARAFFYGGSASVIASHWQVNEQSSAEIFKAFYQSIQAGASKSQALHQAKLAYLDTHQLSQLSPYYWASFTLTGDAGPLISAVGSSSKRLVIAATGVLLLLLFGRYHLYNTNS